MAFPGTHGGDQKTQVEFFSRKGMLLKGNLDDSVKRVSDLISQLMKFNPPHSLSVDGAERSAEIINAYLANNSKLVRTGLNNSTS